MKTISGVLATEDAPDLATLERAGRLLFVPLGGGDVVAHVGRFAPLQLPDFHLFDREIPPETERRELALRLVNARSGCRAVITTKRALENYLHPDCILEACGVELDQSDDRRHVPDAVARRLWEQQQKPIVWDDVPIRARRRLRDKAKRQLIHDAVSRMTPRLLRESDPHGEIRGWLTLIAELLGTPV
ncbi:MAG: ATP-dependent endonuclease [Planctomycetaceae bacterium]|nr:ATP-dependent endonuclease [Planctomycetaceae bacterium]